MKKSLVSVGSFLHGNIIALMNNDMIEKNNQYIADVLHYAM